MMCQKPVRRRPSVYVCSRAVYRARAHCGQSVSDYEIAYVTSLYIVKTRFDGEINCVGNTQIMFICTYRYTAKTLTLNLSTLCIIQLLIECLIQLSIPPSTFRCHMFRSTDAWIIYSSYKKSRVLCALNLLARVTGAIAVVVELPPIKHVGHVRFQWHRCGDDSHVPQILKIESLPLMRTNLDFQLASMR